MNGSDNDPRIHEPGAHANEASVDDPQKNGPVEASGSSGSGGSSGLHAADPLLDGQPWDESEPDEQPRDQHPQDQQPLDQLAQDQQPQDQPQAESWPPDSPSFGDSPRSLPSSAPPARRGIRTFDSEHVAQHATMLANRVRKRFAHLQKRFARDNIDCFRLYDRDIPEVRAVVDWFAGHLVIAEYVRLQTGPEWLPAMAEAVGTALNVPPERRHLRRRATGHGEGPRYAPLGQTGRRIAVNEREMRFLVNLDDRLDTGLFPDHRDTRSMVRSMAYGADFLNLYAYTGSFTCAAAAGGARTTVTVDRSSTYMDWTRDNLELNRLWSDKHRLVRADTLDFLDRARLEGRLWDLVFVDPPSFSHRKDEGTGFDVSRDHPSLLRRVLAITRPGGTIVFSTNHQRFEPHFEGLGVGSLEDITDATVPEDYRNRQIHRCWRIRTRGPAT